MQGQGHDEAAACIQATLAMNVALHQLDQLLDDRESQSSAAVAARSGGIGLPERLEKRSCHSRIDANAGVTDGQLELFFRYPSRLDFHSTLMGELDRIADEVREHLPNPDRIAHDER